MRLARGAHDEDGTACPANDIRGNRPNELMRVPSAAVSAGDNHVAGQSLGSRNDDFRNITFVEDDIDWVAWVGERFHEARRALSPLTALRKGNHRFDACDQGRKQSDASSDMQDSHVGVAFLCQGDGELLRVLHGCLATLRDLAPILVGYPSLGLVGFVVAGVLGLGLAVGILRSGRL